MVNMNIKKGLEAGYHIWAVTASFILMVITLYVAIDGKVTITNIVEHGGPSWANEAWVELGMMALVIGFQIFMITVYFYGRRNSNDR